MDTQDFTGLRPAAFALAYRMLGSVADAEDIVQEGFLRLHRARSAGEDIVSPPAYLSTVVSRLALDQLRSARARRETYIGEWLPEPLLVDGSDDPAVQAELSDSLSVAFLILLESLSPEQRAAFLLHDIFGEPYDRVADILRTSQQNARQLTTRARRHVDEHRPRFTTSRHQQAELADRFFAAARDGELGDLEALLAHDVVFRGDGGGKAPAASSAVSGRSRVARALLGGLRALVRAGGSSARHELNGQPGALFLDRDGQVIATLVLDIADGQVQSLHAVVNPDKLQHLGPVGDLRALLRPGD